MFTGAAPFFDETKVPVQTIELPAPEVKDLAPVQYEVIGSKPATGSRSARALTWC